MKRTMLLSAGILFLFLINAFSQDKEEPSFYRNQVGIQFNPLINEWMLSTGGLRVIQTVSAIRYGYRITKNFTTGMEFVCKFPILTNASVREQSQIYNYFIYRIGLTTRYSILSDKRLQVSRSFSVIRHVTRVWNSGDRSDRNRFGIYVLQCNYILESKDQFDYTGMILPTDRFL
jgi:hypothetical protein